LFERFPETCLKRVSHVFRDFAVSGALHWGALTKQGHLQRTNPCAGRSGVGSATACTQDGGPKWRFEMAELPRTCSAVSRQSAAALVNNGMGQRALAAAAGRAGVAARHTRTHVPTHIETRAHLHQQGTVG
jgi:hypothetical protein